ncbi:MAG: molybdate ABC transporter permease subunit [Spirochaetaceae bacterium]|nr:molybdate ABC transporter permease subunit [Spirochaetaceae bacterium]
MRRRMRPRAASHVGAGTAPFLLAVPMLGLLVLPVLALVLATSPADLAAGLRHPLFSPALWLSARTSVIALVVVLAAGTPLAWWLAAARAGPTRAVELLMRLPIVIPPAVVGIGLLATFGRSGVLGPLLQALGLQVPFSAAAVVLAQVVVAAPFYVQSAAAAFRRVDADLLIVARTLGQRPAGAFLRVTLPLAMPGLIGGASLAWARALGEFGATLLFAGNLPGVTQTMPLAIYTALESDVRVARALSLALAVLGLGLLLALRLLPEIWTRRGKAARAQRGAAAVSATPRQERRPGRPEAAAEGAADWQVRISARLGSFQLDVDLRGGAAPVALIGPNGAGKTTLLRLIAGVHRPDAGLISVGGEVLYDSGRSLTRSPEERRVAYVPQGFGLFPHLSVADNVAFALHAARPRLPRAERRRAAAELLAGMGAAHLLDRLPESLSGGERQRVALTRALLVDPLLLLLDEPLSSLDAQARQTLRAHLADHLAKRARPAIVVSHDARDVLALNADVYAIEGGRIVQHGPAARIAADPATPFLAEFFAG